MAQSSAFMARFQNPDARFGIHPFWFWNGDMDDREIERQIAEMADKGVGGFFICPRQGLQVPYLSETWFRKVELAVRKAEEQGMEVWLYDEYPYPSGIAGGEVTLEHPDAKHYTLEHRTARVSGGECRSLELPWARLLYAKAVPVDPATGAREWSRALDVSGAVGSHQAEPVFQKAGLTAYNRKRFFTYRTIKKLQWTAPEGEREWEIHCFLEQEVSDFKYYGTYVDPCNEEAMRAFIELTHERYAAKLGAYFGKTIKGMFTDEIGLLGKLPWSPKLPEAFRERNGYDLTDHLHALLYAESDNSAKIRYDYYQTVHELIRRAYHKQVYDWCERHGLLYAAEVPSVRMATQRFSHVPGGDSGHEKLGRPLGWILDRNAYSLRYNPKMISSLANQLGRERTLIECFHSVGWSMTLQDAKWMIDRLAALGANFFNFHAFFYTLDGMTKHDAPPSQFVQNPYWRYFGTLGAYVRRISYAMTLGRPLRPIAVLDPTTTFWTHAGNPFHEFNYSGIDGREEAELGTLKAEWRDICKTLAMNQRDYDHLDPEILSEAEVRDGRILIGNAVYSAVVLPPIRNLEAAAWRKLKALLDTGGTVVACGGLPRQSLDGTDEVQREMAAVFAVRKTGGHGGGGAYSIGGHEELLSLLDGLIPANVVFETDAPDRFLMQQRVLDDGSLLVFVSNQEAGTHEARLHWTLREGSRQIAAASRLCLETGHSEPLAVDISGEGASLPLFFAPYASHLLLVHGAQAQADAAAGSNGAVPEPTEARAVDKSRERGAVTAPSEARIADGAGNGGASPAPSAPRTAEWAWELEAMKPWRIRPENMNALRLDTFELRTAQADGAMPEQGAPVQAKTFIDQYSDIAERQHLPLAFTQIFGTPLRMRAAYPLHAVYTATFAVDRLPEACFLMMDRGAVSGDWTIRLNGHSIGRDELKEIFVYDHMNRSADIGEFIRTGVNELAVEVLIEHDWDGVTDALYILGDFGVEHDGRMHVLTVAEPYGALCGRAPAGYPYYAGTFVLHRMVEIAELPEEESFLLRFADWDPDFHDSAEVIVNGVSLGVRAWAPYEWRGRTAILRHGENEAEIRIATSLIGLLEGKRFDYQSHTLQPALDHGGADALRQSEF